MNIIKRYKNYIKKEKIKRINNINKINNNKINNIYDILSINNNVLLPGLLLMINIKNKNIVNKIRNLYKNKQLIGIITVKKKINKTLKLNKNFFLDFKNKFYINNNFKNINIYNIGTIGKILKIINIKKNIILIVKGKYRFKIINKLSNNNNKYFKAKIKRIKYNNINNKKSLIYFDLIKNLTIKIIKYNDYLNNNLINNILETKCILELINIINVNFKFNYIYKQILLEENNIIKKLYILLIILKLEYKKVLYYKKIKDKINKKIKKFKLKYNPNSNIIHEIFNVKEDKLLISLFKLYKKKKKLSKKVKKHFKTEFSNIKKINNQLPEYNVNIKYLNYLINLPWNKYTKDNYDLKRAKKLLDNNHYGLKEIKNRILEYLAVYKLNKGNVKSPIICLYGPPGVGKTSLGISIAKALNRKYVRISLAGLHDEAELRGHRKTYIGAMPGRILQNIKKAKSSNPVFVLDEIDKISIGYNGDASSAMLEILDPEQNKNFYDNYLEIGYDLSKTLFIATANNINNINDALLDRMEIININGYIVEEKINIAKNFIIPQLIKNNGINRINKNIKIEEKILKNIILNYTYEGGIRKLKECIEKIIRNIAKNIVMKKKIIYKINNKLVTKILGNSKIHNNYEIINIPGVCVGLAWTKYGGEIIYIETNIMKGKGELSITGNVGKIMKESVIISMKYIKANYKKYNINYKLLINYDIHLHIPEGSIHKDGPSAGVTIFTSLVSILTNKKIKPYTAMTGEITLSGKILAVGGIKDKILGAKRSLIKYIILPKKNINDVKEINKNLLKNIKIYYIDKLDDIIKIALLNNNN
ncbi:endopeptidase La [Candidatus Shikimatogenerans bostrichidophilus]|uniref:endopeptidase La n=1 Tax=Candidatus Shikimatogenerans bostrichidophilus TaxID=2943807 RepID=UPI002966B27A